MRYLFAELGAAMPYRAASRVLKACGFGNMRASHMAIRHHTLTIGRELEAHRLDAADGQALRSPEAAKSLVVGIDGTYVTHRERYPLILADLADAICETDIGASMPSRSHSLDA